MKTQAHSQINATKSPVFTPVQGGLLQRKCACGNHTVAGGECAECAKNKSGLQRKLSIGASNDPLELEADRVADQVMAAPAHSVVNGAPLRIQRYARQATEGAETAPASVDRVLAGSGRPLAPALRQNMEERFGHDFSRVRVHTGTAAEQSAREVNANAYTVGHKIVFGTGQYAQGTHEGRRLIAHELTHVVQQSSPDAIRVRQDNENFGEATISQSVTKREAVARSVQRQPAPPAEIEMSAEWAFAADKRMRTWRRYARSLGKKDAARIRKSGKLSSEDREEVNAKLRFFEGEAMWAYIREIKPALVEVTREEIQMPGDEPSAAAAAGPSKPKLQPFDLTDQFNRLQQSPEYIDNNMKEVNYFTAETATIHYKDGTTFELGLVPKWMKPPVVEVNCHTPAEDFRKYEDAATKRFGFIVESEIANAPIDMPYQDLLKTYVRYIDFDVQPGTARIVPSRINMLTAPTLCGVLLDSEKRFDEQTQWAAAWGTEVAKVIGWMPAGGWGAKGAGGLVKGATTKAALMSPEARKVALELDKLVTAGGTKTFTVQGVEFASVQAAREGGTLAVSRYSIQLVEKGGLGRVMNAAFEDAAGAIARMNGLKTVTINVGRITNPSWRVYMESIGYVRTTTNAAGGGFNIDWVKTINL